MKSTVMVTRSTHVHVRYFGVLFAHQIRNYRESGPTALFNFLCQKAFTTDVSSLYSSDPWAELFILHKVLCRMPASAFFTT